MKLTLIQLNSVGESLQLEFEILKLEQGTFREKRTSVSNFHFPYGNIGGKYSNSFRLESLQSLMLKVNEIEVENCNKKSPEKDLKLLKIRSKIKRNKI